jgi:hypothetical protein
MATARPIKKTIALPANYFKDDGSIPENVEEEMHNLRALWHFQRNVPTTTMGENDYAEFDAGLVIQQRKTMKHSLKEFTKDRYWELVKKKAAELGMTNCNHEIVLNQDLCDALKNLTRDERNEEKVYLVLYAWFRNKYQFEADTVDEWAKENNYTIQIGSRLGRQRMKDPILDRHGFGQIVKDARSDTIKTITRSMMRDTKWKVVATNKSKQSEKNEVYYERNCISITGRYYVVVAEDAPVSTLCLYKKRRTFTNHCFNYYRNRKKGDRR